jgi:hypothetical protein
MQKGFSVNTIIIIGILIFSCGQSITRSGEDVIYFSIQSEPQESKVFWHIISNTTEVKSTSRTFLGRTPYRISQSLNIPGLSKENARQVLLVIEVERKGYYTRVERIDLDGVLKARELSLMFHLNPGGNEGEELTRPSPPDSIVATDGTETDFIKVSWSPVNRANRYHLYRDKEQNGSYSEEIAVIPEVTFLDRSAISGQAYYYKVRAYNENGFSDFSSPGKGSKKVVESIIEKKIDEEINKKKDELKDKLLNKAGIPSAPSGSTPPKPPSAAQAEAGTPKSPPSGTKPPAEAAPKSPPSGAKPPAGPAGPAGIPKKKPM